MKTVVITGASKGIGKAIAEKFASENFNLAICARNKNELNQTKIELMKINANVDVLIVVADVSKKNDRENFAKKIITHFSLTITSTQPTYSDNNQIGSQHEKV